MADSVRAVGRGALRVHAGGDGAVQWVACALHVCKECATAYAPAARRPPRAQRRRPQAMSSHARRPCLTLASLNVNGLRDARKRAGLFHRLHARADGVDILLLQETHHESQAEADEWMRQGLGPGMPWCGRSAWAHGTRASRGVAILVHESVPVEEVEVRHADPEGRVVVIGLRAHGQSFRLASVYAPSVPSFFFFFFWGAKALQVA